MQRKGMAWIGLVLALCLILALVAGCGGGKKEPAGQQPAGQQAEKKEQPKEAANDDKYPSRTIEVINQFGPGGGTDIFVRGIGVPAAQILKVSIIPISVTGGGGVAATDRFLQEPADGYTLRAIGPEQVINHLMKREDLTQMVPIIRCQYDQSIFVVKKGSKFKTIQDVVEYAKANPGKLTIGGTDAAGYDEVLVNLWADKAGVQVKYVPFSSGSEANAAVLGGHIDVLHEEVGPMKALLDSKDVVPLVIFLEKRAEMFPDVPTAKELGWDVTIGRWRGFAAKKGTPPDRIDKLYKAFAKAMESPIYKAMEKENLLDIRPGLLGPEDFQKFLDNELKIYGDVLKKLGIVK